MSNERNWDITGRSHFADFAKYVYDESEFNPETHCAVIMVVPKRVDSGEFGVYVAGTEGFGGPLEHHQFLLQFALEQPPIQALLQQLQQAMAAHSLFSRGRQSGLVAARAVPDIKH